jgi:hypothetical protein
MERLSHRTSMKTLNNLIYHFLRAYSYLADKLPAFMNSRDPLP